MADQQEDDLTQATLYESDDFIRIVKNRGTVPVSQIMSRTVLETRLSTLYEPIGGGGTGWQTVTETWTRTGNHTFTVTGDLTTKYHKGTFARYKDGGAYEYGTVLSSAFSSPNTTITLFTNTDYLMAAGTITDTAISYQASPQSFPSSFNWTPTHTRGGTNYTSVPTVQVAQFRVMHGLVHFYEKHTQNAVPGGTSYQFMTLPSTNPLAHPQIVHGINFTTGVSMNCVITASANTMLIEKYDGTVEATASQVYIVEGFYFI